MLSMGLTLEEYLESFERINLLHDYPGKTLDRQDKFPRHEARVAAGKLRRMFAGRDIVLLGRAVSSCWDRRLAEVPFLEWTVDPLFYGTVAVVPHPSGRNLWYNDLANRRAAGRFWQALLASLPGPLEAGSIAERRVT